MHLVMFKSESNHRNFDKIYSAYVFCIGSPLSAPPVCRINLHTKRCVVFDYSIYVNCFVFQGGHIRLSIEYPSWRPGNKPHCRRHG